MLDGILQGDPYINIELLGFTPAQEQGGAIAQVKMNGKFYTVDQMFDKQLLARKGAGIYTIPQDKPEYIKSTVGANGYVGLVENFKYDAQNNLWWGIYAPSLKTLWLKHSDVAFDEQSLKSLGIKDVEKVAEEKKVQAEKDRFILDKLAEKGESVIVDGAGIVADTMAFLRKALPFIIGLILLIIVVVVVKNIKQASQ